MYTVPDNGNYETYMVPSSELNPQIPSPVFVNVDRMANDGTPEFVVDPGLYYPATNYGYYCTGYQPSSECDDQHTVFGVQGAEVQYTGSQTENMPCIYYTPGYGYGESPFNPYNPYIPGAMIGADGAYVGTQPYYTISPYPSAVSSSGYVPVLVQSGPDADASSSTNTSLDVGSSAKRSQPQTPASFYVNPSNSAPSQAHALTGASQGAKANTGNSKRPMGSRTNGSSGPVHGVSTDVHQSSNTSVSPPTAGSLSHEKFLPQANTVNQSYAVGRGVSDYGSGTNGQAVFNDPWSQYYYRRVSNDVSGNCDPLGEQNRGPRTNKSKNQFIVKAYTTKAGDCNPEGNITISADSYNKDDFPVDYVNSKFYVIKSYSEDDVHKSVKYNVWSSTPNGNRKLNSAYEEAQKIAAGKPRRCPIFMFFSVNASGQFCGVAEMIGPVDFDKDMDFWQQDKWSGSFPVKWHVIKDVPNPTFRHIILENNEHKPVTNSRDTQEIMYKQGMEMLRLFKNYSSKTSLLDDFMYYEHRQKIMHEERSRLLRKANVNSHAIAPPVKLPFMDETSTTWVEKAVQPDNSSTEKLSSTTSDVDNQGHRANVSTLKIGSLSIHPKQIKGNSTLSSSLITTMRNNSAPPANVVTVGSMPVKVDSVNPKTPGILTIGTIPLDPKSLQQGKVGGVGKGGPQR